MKPELKDNIVFQLHLYQLKYRQISFLWKGENVPEINKSVFESYCELKRRGVAGQQEKLFTSRKISSVKTINKKATLYMSRQ